MRRHGYAVGTSLHVVAFLFSCVVDDAGTRLPALSARPLQAEDYVAVLSVIAMAVSSSPWCARQFLHDGGLSCVAQLLRLLPPARLRIDLYMGVMRLVCALTGSTPPPEYDIRGTGGARALAT